MRAGSVLLASLAPLAVTTDTAAVAGGIDGGWPPMAQPPTAPMAAVTSFTVTGRRSVPAASPPPAARSGSRGTTVAAAAALRATAVVSARAADMLLGKKPSAGSVGDSITWASFKKSSAGPLDAATVKTLVASLTVEQAAGLARSAVLSEPSVIRYISAMRGYELWCMQKGLAPFPVTADSLSAFIAHYTLVLGRASQSTDGIVTGIKRALQLSNQAHLFLDAEDEALARHAVKGVKRIEAETGVRHVQRRLPLLLAHLMDVYNVTQAVTSPLSFAVAAQDIMIMFVAHACMLRVGEYMDGALKLKHVTFHEANGAVVSPALVGWRDRVSYAVLVLMESKGPSDRKGETVVVVKQPLAVDALSLLMAYYHRFSLHLQSGEEALFCHLQLVHGNVARVPSRVLSDSYLNQRITAWLQRAGYDSDRLSSHSLRVGGCTDAHYNGVEEAAVLRNGRWRDASTMQLYWRSDPHLASRLMYDADVAVQRIEYAAAAKLGRVSVAAALDVFADEDTGLLSADLLMVDVGGAAATVTSGSAAVDAARMSRAGAGDAAPPLSPVGSATAAAAPQPAPTTTALSRGLRLLASPALPVASHGVSAPSLAPSATGKRPPSGRVSKPSQVIRDRQSS